MGGGEGMERRGDCTPQILVSHRGGSRLVLQCSKVQGIKHLNYRKADLTVKSIT